MKRREWNQFVELSHHAGIQYCRTFELRAAMDHAMAHTEHTRTAVVSAEPTGEGIKCFLPIASCDVLVGKAFTTGILRGQTWRRADALDLTACCELPAVSGRSLKNAELQTR